MASHIESCPKCQAALAGYRNIGEMFRESRSEDALSAAQDRVWKKFTAPKLYITGKQHNEKAVRKLWKRRIAVPLPAALAAALVVAFALFVILPGAGGAPESVPISTAVQVQSENVNLGFDDYRLIPVGDMNDVVQLLSTGDSDDHMIILLPNQRVFSRTGQPALINAADYSAARRNFRR
ncbi:MAG: hypothetical protein FWD91_06110 [Treponema sp.]|nr:hypothetical protein [Treponema sp.]